MTGEQTQQFFNNISPYLIKSLGSAADRQLRYTFGSWNYGGNTRATALPLVPGVTTLASTTLSEGTFNCSVLASKTF